MRHTNQSIKVRIVEEDYSVTGNTTKCCMRIRTQITPSWYHEFSVIGWANFNPEDTYDESIGRKIAKARAVTKAYKEAYRCATKYLRRQLMYIDSYNRFQLKVSDVIYGNQKYLERILRLNQSKIGYGK